MDSDLKEQLKALAATFHGPVGPTPLERVIRRHFSTLEALRAIGMTWQQIGLLLAREGVHRADGLPFPAAHIRGVVGRQRKRASAPPMIAVPITKPARHLPREEPIPWTKAACGISPRTASTQRNTVKSPRRVPGSSDEVSLAESPMDRARVLEIMRRSARARRPID